MPTAGNLGISAVALIRPHHHVKVPQRERSRTRRNESDSESKMKLKLKDHEKDQESNFIKYSELKQSYFRLKNI